MATVTPRPASAFAALGPARWWLVDGAVLIAALIAIFLFYRADSDPRHVAAREVDALADAMMAFREPLRNDLTVLQMQVVEGSLNPKDIPAALRLAAQRLDQHGVGPGEGSAMRRDQESERYFAWLESRIARSPTWPGDREAAYYAAIARAALKQDRDDYQTLVGKGLPPTAALASSYQIILWTSGHVDRVPLGDANPFREDKGLIDQAIRGLLPAPRGADANASSNGGPGTEYGALSGAKH